MKPAFACRSLAFAVLLACAGTTWAQADNGAQVQTLFRDKQYAQALKLIDDALAKTPDDPKMRFRRGVALSYMDKPNDALKVFEKLAADHPDMPAPHNNIAVLLAAKGDYERARTALESAIRTNPAYATAYQNLGDVYARLASQAYSKALQLDKSDSSLPPKLALLRELTADPATGAALAASPLPADKPAAVAASAKPSVVAAAPTGPAAALPAASGPTTKPASPAPLAAASKPAAASPAVPAAPPAAQAVAEVNKAVQAWASAWSRRDMPGYIGAYTADHDGQAGSRRAWEDDRRARIMGKASIKVALADLSISVDGNKATARFRQMYEAGALKASSRKTLDLVRDGNRWLIKRESSGS